MKNNIVQKVMLRLADQPLTYKRVFVLTGLEEKLNNIYIEIEDISQVYVNIFYKKIKDFMRLPLFSNLSIEKSNDLLFLRDSDEFIKYLDTLFNEIEKKLSPKFYKIRNFIEEYPPKSEVKFEEIKKSTGLDKATILFILDTMKKKEEIFDFNDRKINLI